MLKANYSIPDAAIRYAAALSKWKPLAEKAAKTAKERGGEARAGGYAHFLMDTRMRRFAYSVMLARAADEVYFSNDGAEKPLSHQKVSVMIRELVDVVSLRADFFDTADSAKRAGVEALVLELMGRKDEFVNANIAKCHRYREWLLRFDNVFYATLANLFTESYKSMCRASEVDIIQINHSFRHLNSFGAFGKLE